MIWTWLSADAFNSFSRLFRVFIHIYDRHFEDMKALQAVPACDTFLLEFYFFVTEHKLVKEKDMEPLQDKIDKLCQSFAAVSGK